MEPKYKTNDKVKIIGKTVNNGDVGKDAIIIESGRFLESYNDFYYIVKVKDIYSQWSILEKDLMLLGTNEIVEIINNDSTYCHCTGPYELRKFDSFSFNFCLSCRKEKR